MPEDEEKGEVEMKVRTKWQVWKVLNREKKRRKRVNESIEMEE